MSRVKQTSESETDFLTVRVVASRLGLSSARVYQLVAANEIPTVSIGKRILVPRIAWEEWIEQKATEAQANQRLGGSDAI